MKPPDHPKPQDQTTQTRPLRSDHPDHPRAHFKPPDHPKGQYKHNLRLLDSIHAIRAHLKLPDYPKAQYKHNLEVLNLNAGPQSSLLAPRPPQSSIQAEFKALRFNSGRPSGLTSSSQATPKLNTSIIWGSKANSDPQGSLQALRSPMHFKFVPLSAQLKPAMSSTRALG